MGVGRPPGAKPQTRLLCGELARTEFFAGSGGVWGLCASQTHSRVIVPDPTEHLVQMIQEFCDVRQARLVVGIQGRDTAMTAFLGERGIPFVTFDGAENYEPADYHWNPAGHAFVANRLGRLLAGMGASAAGTKE